MSVPSETNQDAIWRYRLEQYLEDRGNEGLSLSTISDYETVLTRWTSFALLHAKGPEIFDQVAIERFLDAQNLGESSRRSYTSHIRVWCEYWKSQDTKSDPWVVPADWQEETDQHTDQAEVWRDRLEHYLGRLRAVGRSSGTVENNKTVLTRWVGHALSHDKSPEIFDPAAIDQFLDECDLGDGSRGSYTSHIRGWCEYWESHDVGAIPRAPAGKRFERNLETWLGRIDDFIESNHTLSQSALGQYRSILQRWTRFALENDYRPAFFDQDAIDQFFSTQDGLAPNSRSSYTSNIHMWCRYWEARDRDATYRVPTGERFNTEFDAWVVRAGRQGEVEQHNLDHGVVTIGWGDWGDRLDEFAERQDFGEHLEQRFGEESGNKRSARDQIWRFGKEIQINDLIVMPQKRPSLDSRQIAIGRVTGACQFDATQPEGARKRRTVDWLKTDIPREAVGEDLIGSIDRPSTVFGLKTNDAPYRIQYLAEHGEDPGDRNPSSDTASRVEDPRTQRERLEDAAEKLLCKVSFLEEIVSLLEDKGQVILYGPPGTGKTYLAQELAEALAPWDQARSLVQFHPAYSYEDFFEGYRPVTDDDKQMTYELTPGPLAKLAAHAAKNEEQHVMVIDEINRANLPRVLGELLFLLEYRDKSMQVLHRSDSKFKLPKNLWFIGTMNTADRSIALIDAAMRRRFHFIPFFPESGPMDGLLHRWTEKNAPSQTWIPGLVSAVNVELAKELGGDHLQLGPSHFMKKDLDKDGFERIWRYNIEPFIEDQLFGQPDKIKRFRFDAVWQQYSPAVFPPQRAQPAADSQPESTTTKPVAGKGGRQNNDAMVSGQEIYDNYQAGDRTYTWMGRQSGLSGQPLRDDLDSGDWRTWQYEVRYESISGNRNWFPIESFIALLDQQELNGAESDQPAADGGG